MTESTGASISSNSLVGKIIFGRYLLEHKVGQGGMAWVFRARDLENDEIVAAKILLPHIAESPELRERFLREARIQAQLEHEHIVQLYDANEEDGVSAIILEWVNGETMLDVSKRLNGPLPAKELFQLIAPVLDALGYAHDQQMVHRDIKLENIMIHWDGEHPIPKLADFGLAKLLDQMEENQTKTGMIMGTLKYMAPEQVNATKSVDQRADIYSMGICLYCLATFDSPFSGSMQEMIVQILYEGVPDPRLKNPNISDTLADVIIQSVAKSAEMRFQSCAAFKNAFAGAVEELSVNSLGETLPAMTQPRSFDVLHPPALKTYEPLPSAVGSGSFFGRSKPGVGRAKSTMIVGGRNTSLVVWVLLACLVVGGFLGWAFFGSGWFSSASSKDAGATLVPRPRACIEGNSRPCFATPGGKIGPTKSKGVGLCKEGLQSCKDGVFGACQNAVLPGKEVCNDKDDDCDGKVDEDFAKKGSACTQVQGECKLTGQWTCDAKGALQCRLSSAALPKGTYHVALAVHPLKTPFRMGLRRKKLSVTGAYCLSFSSRRSRRITLRAPGFYTCRVWVRANKGKLKLQMRRRNRRSLEPRRNYCLR